MLKYGSPTLLSNQIFLTEEFKTQTKQFPKCILCLV